MAIPSWHLLNLETLKSRISPKDQAPIVYMHVYIMQAISFRFPNVLRIPASLKALLISDLMLDRSYQLVRTTLALAVGLRDLRQRERGSWIRDSLARPKDRCGLGAFGSSQYEWRYEAKLCDLCSCYRDQMLW